MTRRHREPLPPRALAAFLEGEVAPSEAAEIETHLRDSGAARRHLEQLDGIRRTLARLPDAVDAELVDPAELWRALAAPQAPRRSRLHGWSRPVWAAMGAVLGAAVAASLLIRGSPSDSAPVVAQLEFRAKSAAAELPDDRWVGIEVMRVDRDGSAHPLPAPGTVHAGDKLVFRHISGGPAPFGFLMVFAVDAAAQIHWYYPAYETAGTDPSSIAIEHDGRQRSLPDAIEHDLPTGPLVFYAVFTRTPLHVLDVERRMTELIAHDGWNPDLPPRAPVAGAAERSTSSITGVGQHLIRATVVP